MLLSVIANRKNFVRICTNIMKFIFIKVSYFTNKIQIENFGGFKILRDQGLHIKKKRKKKEEIRPKSNSRTVAIIQAFFFKSMICHADIHMHLGGSFPHVILVGFLL